MRWSPILVAAALAALAACGGSKRAAECGPDVYDLETFLKHMDRGLAWLDADPARLVARPELPKKFVRPSVVLHVGPDGYAIGGARIGDAELAGRLDLGRYSAYASRVERDQLVLVIEPAAPWERVVNAVEAARRIWIHQVVFVFGGKPGVDAPPRTKVDDDLDKLDANPAERVSAIGAIARKLTASCEPLQKAFANVVRLAPEDRENALVNGIGPALLECHCKADLPALRSLLYRMLATKPLGIIDLKLDPDRGSRIELPPETPWRDASKRLPTASGTAIWLAVPAPPPPPDAVPGDAGAPTD